MNGAAGNLSSNPAIMSYKDAVASNQHQQARSTNVSKSSGTSVGSIRKPLAGNAVDEAHTRAKIDSAGLTASPDNPIEEGFITATKVKSDAFGAVNNSGNNKLGRKLRTAKYGGRS
jgi:hypothetical protein